MANENIIPEYDEIDREISFKLLPNQPTTGWSVGSWSPHPIIPPSDFFIVPRNRRLRLVDIRQTKKLDINLIFSYIKNLSFSPMKIDVNSVYSNKSNEMLNIDFDPLDQIQFIAYPTSPPSTKMTEIINVRFHLFYI